MSETPPQPIAKPTGFGRICAVVVTYNIGPSFERGFQSLLGQVDHAIVIDNGSTDNTVQVLEQLQNAHPHFLDILINEGNGLAKAQNMGIRKAKAAGYDWVLLLDHDSRLGDGMIAAMKDAYQKLSEPEKLGILAPFIRDENTLKDPTYVTPWMGVLFRRVEFGDNTMLENVVNVIASGSLIPTRIFDAVGYMDEQYFIDYIDTEFCLRLISHGYHICAVRDALLYHRLGERKAYRFLGLQIITTNHCPLRRYYIYRNKIKTLKRYLFRVPSYAMYDLAAVVYDVIRILMYEQDKGEKMRFIFRGICDAMRGVSGPRPA